ncbi:hypothetical protein JCM14076_31300 [Methylosoma difficile]
MEDCVTHVENDPLWSTQNKHKYENKSFISGHVSFVRFLQVFNRSDYYTFATFRNPIDHVISHLAWVRHLCDPGKESFLAGHPEWVQDVSRKLTTVDFSNPDQLHDFASNLSPMESAIFDNSQTRYLLAIPGHQLVTRPKLAEALQNLDSLSLIGLTEFYSESMALLSKDMGWELPLHGERLNEGATKYNLDGSRLEIRQALKPLIWADNHIYAQAKHRFFNRIEALLRPDKEVDISNNPNGYSIPKSRGVFDVCTTHLLAGWIIIENNPLASVYLRISVNDGACIYFIKADKYRKDIKDKAIHPTGFCGFSLKFSNDAALKKGDMITVTFMGNNQSLFGQPKVVV